MPIQRCTLPQGGSGFRWGSKGKCYKSKKDAIRQGLAIEGPKKFASKATEEEFAEIFNIAELSIVEKTQLNLLRNRKKQ